MSTSAVQPSVHSGLREDVDVLADERVVPCFVEDLFEQSADGAGCGVGGSVEFVVCDWVNAGDVEDRRYVLVVSCLFHDRIEVTGDAGAVVVERYLYMDDWIAVVERVGGAQGGEYGRVDIAAVL